MTAATTFAVLGLRLRKDGRLPPELCRRLNACLRRYREGDRVVVCGGRTRATHAHSEAVVMRQYLETTGRVPRSHIVLVNRSHDTIGNIKELLAICRRVGARRVTCVTSDWHVPRARYLWKLLAASSHAGDARRDAGSGGVRATFVGCRHAASRRQRQRRRRTERRYLRWLREATEREGAALETGRRGSTMRTERRRTLARRLRQDNHNILRTVSKASHSQARRTPRAQQSSCKKN